MVWRTGRQLSCNLALQPRPQGTQARGGGGPRATGGPTARQLGGAPPDPLERLQVSLVGRVSHDRGAALPRGDPRRVPLVAGVEKARRPREQFPVSSTASAATGDPLSALAPRAPDANTY